MEGYRKILWKPKAGVNLGLKRYCNHKTSENISKRSLFPYCCFSSFLWFPLCWGFYWLPGFGTMSQCQSQPPSLHYFIQAKFPDWEWHLSPKSVFQGKMAWLPLIGSGTHIWCNQVGQVTSVTLESWQLEVCACGWWQALLREVCGLSRPSRPSLLKVDKNLIITESIELGSQLNVGMRDMEKLEMTLRVLCWGTKRTIELVNSGGWGSLWKNNVMKRSFMSRKT